MSIRNRKFTYIFENYSNEVLSQLKELDCKYHIIGIENNSLYGFIYFKEGKTESSIRKKIKYDNILHTDANPLEMRNDILKKEKTWEFGSLPKQFREKPVDMNMFCRFIMKQHEQLIQDVICEKNQLLEKNNKLQEEKDNLQKSLLEKITVQNTMTYSTTDNSTNKKVTNINLFLNTECKDAITMRDFINELVIEDEDLICLKNHGYIESISRLLNKALINYDIYKRPIHCTDLKREVMHVKDQEGWKKETPTGESANLDKAFSRLSQLQCKKMMNYYSEIDGETTDEKAFVMTRIAEASGNEEVCKKKIIKNIIENIRL